MGVPFEGTYSSLPVSLQNAAITAFGWWVGRKRYGGRYPEFTRFLNEAQWWNIEQLHEWQSARLRDLIRHSMQNVPFYRERFGALGIEPEDIRSSEDLHGLPVLTRKDIVDNLSRLVDDRLNPRTLAMGHTSGTTGSPLQVYYDDATTQITYALLDRQYRWAGVQLGRAGDRVAVLRGNVVVPLKQNKPPYWRRNHYQNQLLLSAFHLSDETLPEYVQELERFKPAVLDGYPSTLYLVARHLLATGRTFPVSAVISASETLFEFQREAIEAAFECRVFDYLAAAERVLFSTECDHHEGLHLSMEYGITEFLDENHKPLAAGGAGIMVCTSLHNYAMPLIRYVTNDVSALKPAPCSCKRGLPLMENVTTKAEDILALADGRMISPSVLTHPFKPMHAVEESQVVQLTADHIEIRIVPRENYGPQDTEHLLDEFRHRLGDQVRVDVKLVDQIERTSSGKFKWVVSHVHQAVHVPESR